MFLKSIFMKTFETAAQFRKWLEKNHTSASEIVIKFYRKSLGTQTLTVAEALDQALCFGWTSAVIKRIDEESFMSRFTPRRPGGIWSAKVLEKIVDLKKRKLMRQAGLAAFEKRDKSGSLESIAVFSPSYLNKFKKNKKAWEFFNKQTPGYRKYMAFWVMQPKRKETQIKHLEMLIEDSANESKLKRVVEAQARYSEKSKPKYEDGKTPIEAAKNIGPVVGAELRSIGIQTLEQLQARGWEKSFHRLCEMYPHRIHLMCLMGLIGAVENQSAKKLEPHLKSEARAVLREIKSEFS